MVLIKFMKQKLSIFDQTKKNTFMLKYGTTKQSDVTRRNQK